MEKAKIIKTKDGYWILVVAGLGTPPQWVATITPPEGRKHQLVLPPEVFSGLIRVRATASRQLRSQKAKAAAERRSRDRERQIGER